MIPEQLQNEEFRFIRLNFFKLDDDASKAPLKGIEWSKNLLRFDDPILLKHIKDGGNVGWVAGPGGVRFVDLDEPALKDGTHKIFFEKLQTLIMRTGSGNYHLPIITDYDKNHRLISGYGEYRADGQYVVVAPSRHPRTGEQYSIFKDGIIAEIDYATVKKILKPLIMGSIKSGEVEQVKFKGALKVIPDHIDNLIKKGVNKGDTSRNLNAWIIVKELYKRDFEKKDILPLVIQFNKNCKPPKSVELVKRHVKYLLEHAEKYLIDKVDSSWLKAQNYGEVDERAPKSMEDLVKEDLPDIEYWIHGLIPKNTLILVGGRAGSFKSMFLLALSLAMVRERFFLKHFRTVDKPKVLLYDLENSERLIHRRVRYILGEELKGADLSGFHYLTEFDKKNMKKEMRTAMKYDIIILDSYRRFLRGSENESEITDKFYQEWFKPLIAKNKTVMIAHHFRKAKLEEELSEGDILELFRGSGDIGAQADYALTLFKENESKKDDNMTFEVYVSKAKNRLGIPMYNFAFRVTKNDDKKMTIFEYLGEKRILGPKMTRRNKIMDLITAGVSTRKEILKHFPRVSIRTVDGDLRELAERSMVISDEKKGTYRIVESIGDFV